MPTRLICAANASTRVRACTLRGEHAPGCWGSDVCRGCVPTPAEHGLLCWDHWVKLRDGAGRMVDLVTHMWSVYASGSVDASEQVSGAFGGSWTLSESHIIAGQIYSDLCALAVAYANEARVPEPEWAPGEIADRDHGFGPRATVAQVHTVMRDIIGYLYPVLDTAVAMPASAVRAVELVQSMGAAARKFSLVEQPHMMPVVRCSNCQHALLRWEPPIAVRGEVLITCDFCGATHTQDDIEAYIEQLKQHREHLPQ